MPQATFRTPRRFAGLLVVSTALVLGAAACGGGSDSGTSASGSGGNPGNRGGEFAAYTQCLQKNGVTMTLPSGMPRTRSSDGAGYPSGMPRPSRSGGGRGGFPGGGFGKPAGVSQDTWDKAQAACASLRPSFGGNGRGRNGADGAYRNCLQQNGVTPGSGLSSADPALKKAQEKCKVLLPSVSPTPTS